jgi:mono/diheme cytochrome c family protein
MKKKNLPLVVLTVLFFMLYFTFCTNSNQNSGKVNTNAKDTSIEGRIKQGKYLVTIMGCNDCHSPKKNSANGPVVIPELTLSGFPSDRPKVKFEDKMIKEGFAMFYPDLTGAAGPWGISFASNLTPDDTGLSGWSEGQFKKAITQGKYEGLDNVRMLLPPMPWQDFANLTDDDIKAIFSYLQSIKPVKNMVPAFVAPDQM